MVRVVSTGDAAAATACDAEERRRGATGRWRAMRRRGGGARRSGCEVRRGGGARWSGGVHCGGEGRGRVVAGVWRWGGIGKKREACGGGRRSGERTCEEGEADAQRMTHQVFVSLPYFLGAEIEITPHY
jgi:hypothetical protein